MLSPVASPTVSATPTPVRSPSPTPLPGAQNFHQWGSITVFNGLPSDSVRAVSQTPDGVMWFGTDNGLARFDGRRIQNFSLGGSDANRVLVLKTTPTGELWIGTRAGAFVYFENNFQPVENTQSLGITAILLGVDTHLGTDSGVVLRVSRNENGTPTADKVFPDAIRTTEGNPLGVTSLVENEGKIFAGTAGRGIFVVKESGFSEFPTAPRPIFVNTLTRSETGKVWLGADAGNRSSGIYRFEGGSRGTRVAAPSSNVLALEANDGGLWAGTERNGLFHIAESSLTKTYTFENTSGGLRSDTIYTLFTDREGVLWIGTNRGVSRFDRLGSFQQTVSDISNSNFIRTLFFNRTTIHDTEWQDLYAGSNRGLFEFNGENWDKVQALGDKAIYAIDVSNKDSKSIIVATSEGVFNITGKLIIEGDVRAMNSFNGRTYAAIYGRGVFDISSNFPRLVYANGMVTSLGGYVGKMWIGTAENGLFSFDGKTVKLELAPEALKSGTIWSIYEAGYQTGVWIGGQHGVFFVLDGVPEQIIGVEDVRHVWGGAEGHVWAATTTRGLMHARHDEHFGWLVSSVGFEQGLPSEKAFSILPVNEGLLIATNRGVVIYKPGLIAPKLIPTRVISQRVHDLDELRSAIVLAYPQNSLLVEVAGQSSRTFPEEFQYGFLLKAASGEILDRRLSNEPQYAPADLKPGDYVIESVAFNRDLLASEPLLIQFSVAGSPFPWTSTALGALLAIALIALVWAVIERRRIAERNRQLAAARLDLANEAERERRRIARDLHDQTLADLRSLIMKSDRVAPALRVDIETVSTEIRRICEDLSPSVLENVGLVAALDFLLAHTFENRMFTTDDHVEDRLSFPVAVQLQIYRIVQEVLSNIQRHAAAERVRMDVRLSDDETFQVEIEDDGNSFEPGNTTVKGRGIENIRARASLINARIDWKIIKTGGTHFSLSISPADDPSHGGGSFG